MRLSMTLCLVLLCVTDSVSTQSQQKPEGELVDRAKKTCKDLREKRTDELENQLKGTKGCVGVTDEYVIKQNASLAEIAACYRSISPDYADYWLKLAQQTDALKPAGCKANHPILTLNPDSFRANAVRDLASVSNSMETQRQGRTNRKEEVRLQAASDTPAALSESERAKYTKKRNEIREFASQQGVQRITDRFTGVTSSSIQGWFVGPRGRDLLTASDDNVEVLFRIFPGEPSTANAVLYRVTFLSDRSRWMEENVVYFLVDGQPFEAKVINRDLEFDTASIFRGSSFEKGKTREEKLVVKLQPALLNKLIQAKTIEMRVGQIQTEYLASFYTRCRLAVLGVSEGLLPKDYQVK